VVAAAVTEQHEHVGYGVCGGCGIWVVCTGAVITAVAACSVFCWEQRPVAIQGSQAAVSCKCRSSWGGADAAVDQWRQLPCAVWMLLACAGRVDWLVKQVPDNISAGWSAAAAKEGLEGSRRHRQHAALGQGCLLGMARCWDGHPLCMVVRGEVRADAAEACMANMPTTPDGKSTQVCDIRHELVKQCMNSTSAACTQTKPFRRSLAGRFDSRQLRRACCYAAFKSKVTQ
jgi:hypothetical protein